MLSYVIYNYIYNIYIIYIYIHTVLHFLCLCFTFF